MKLKSATFFILFTVISIFWPAVASADQQIIDCGQGAQSQVNSFVQIPADSTDIYVRASLPEDHVPATLYFQSFATQNAVCVKIGNVVLTDNWQKIGRVPVDSRGVVGSLTLTLTDNAPNFGASSPQAVFTSAIPPCIPETGCNIKYGDNYFSLSPKKLSTTADSLKVGKLSAIENEQIKQVIYSVDGVQVYTDKALKPFNENYVGGGEHSIERTIILISGQSLSDRRIVQKGSVANVNYLFVSSYYRYSKLIIFAAILFTIFIVYLIIFAVLKIIYKRRQWTKTHIFTKTQNTDKTRSGPVPSNKFNYTLFDMFREHKKVFTTLASALILIFVVYSFVLTTFKVDGISMFPTLKDKSIKPLYILPAIIGNITGSGYTPARGTIVVIKHDDNNLFNDKSVQQKSYVVKRIVGLPEERVVVKDEVITVYNKQYPNGFNPDNTFHWLKNISHEYSRLDITLKQGELFVMGDNRDNSIDSRFYGPIKSTEIVGKVL